MDEFLNDTAEANREAGVPAGFERIDLGQGFSAQFGAVYKYRDEQKLGFRVAAHHLNPANACHGGAMATFADALIAAVRSGPGTRAGHTPTITLSVDYLAPAPHGSWVEGTVTLLKTTKSMMFIQALITADGEPAARFNGIYRYYR